MSTAESITVVQRIDTHWTKQSRGAPGANRRNATPQALRLPLEQRPPGDYSIIEHSSGFYERRGFDPQQSVSFELFKLERPMRYGAVLVQKEADRLRVSWDNTSADAGMPLRPPKKKDVFELALNQWARVIYNGRFSGMEGSFWWYHQRVLNIGAFKEVAASVFVATEPHVVMDKTAILY